MGTREPGKEPTRELPRRRLPSVDSLLRSGPGRKAVAKFGRPLVKRAIQEALALARSGAARGIEPPESDLLLAHAVHRAARIAFGLTPVINATGVVLHTGLGRAPLPEPAVREAGQAAIAYSDLEIDRETGKRSRRTGRAETLLTAVTGAEDAFVVNNNAAALVLALAALARRKEVLVSRGELIEIGGEFRLPDIMRASGAKLLEVGTTNRTRLTDYRKALSEKTGMILKVHPSNYRVTGFSESPSAAALSDLARRRGVPFLYDLGSGLLVRAAGVPRDEPVVSEALRDGADLVCFSGDKLLGGPQAGILLGRAEMIEKVRRHPLARALRVDKMQVAALEVILRGYTRGEWRELPVWRMLLAPAAELRGRAQAVAAGIKGARVQKTQSVAGGGSLPGHGLDSWAVELPTPRPAALAALLRSEKPPVFCRTEERSLLFDLRTVDPSDDGRLARAIGYALEQE